ncbi:unnamed protein product [Ceutorhynchus assimilis]|uniref:Uncharacterized protein n=1 Tax=Ceutorhynchus assimilis TaxID=467358 RepID=A0A9N9MCB3_9CUCU|nr:unnamed protein product [Ceutorhynchus assimilis]
MDNTRLTAVVMMIIYCFLKCINASPLDNEDINEEDTTPICINQMGKKLHYIPQGQFSIISANFAYNVIEELPPYVFYKNLYKNLEILVLSHNRISNIDAEAFRELRQLRKVDLSSNNITHLEANVFRQSHRLERVDLSFNNIITDPEKPLFKSQSVQTLILAYNQIVNVYDITFARLPNLQILFLDNNLLFYLSPNCFVHLRHLQYVSLSNTNVFKLTNSMFKTIPRLMDLSETPLAKKFEPPLRKVRSGQLVKLMDIEEYISDLDDS